MMMEMHVECEFLESFVSIQMMVVTNQMRAKGGYEDFRVDYEGVLLEDSRQW
jgi:hypothetical protein